MTTFLALIALWPQALEQVLHALKGLVNPGLFLKNGTNDLSLDIQHPAEKLPP